MKKLFLGVMMFALIMSSCNKYANDFQALKDQISALSLQVQGVTALQTQLTATTAQITALQTAVAALPNAASVTALATGLTTANTNIAALQTALNTLAANGATTAQLTALSTQLNAALAKSDSTNAANLTAAIADVNAALAANTTANTTSNAATQAAVNALTALVTANQNSLNILLASTAMYNGDVTLTTNPEVDFYIAKLYQMGIINGSLTVNTAALDAAHIIKADSILNVVVAVIGGGHNVSITDMASKNLTLGKLTSVSGDYSVVGSDVLDPMINNVKGNVTLNYPGDYTSTSLNLVGGNLVLVNQPSNGTGNIDFPNVNVTGQVGDGTNLNGTLVFNSTATHSINLGLAGMTGYNAQVNNLTAPYATSITIGTTAINAGGLSITALVAAPTTITAAATSSAGPINIVAGNVSTVNLSKLATSTAPIFVVMQAGATFYNGTVDLSAFNSGVPVIINGPQTINLLGSWYGPAGSQLIAPQATTVNLPVYQWLSTTIQTLPAVKWLTLGGAADMVNLNLYPTLLTADITGTVKQLGSPNPTWWSSITAGVNAANPNLTSLTLGGLINTATLIGNPVLTSLTTSGVVNTLDLENATVLTSATLGHNAFIGAIGHGGPGSDLWVINNPALTSLAPSALDWMHTLTVTGNGALASFNFSSYHTDMYSGFVTILIDAPATMGAYTASVAPVSAGNPGIQAVIKSNDIMTLKPYLTQVLADSHVNVGTTFSINVGIPVATTLTAVMTADAASWTTLFGYTNLVTGGPITTANELGLVVAQ